MAGLFQEMSHVLETVWLDKDGKKHEGDFIDIVTDPRDEPYIPPTEGE